MSAVSGVNSNFGFEAMAVAMNKRATEEQGQIAMNLLESTVQSVQQINAQTAQGNVGRNVNTYA